MVDSLQQRLAARLDSLYMARLLAIQMTVFEKISHTKNSMKR
jgi:hypothetical protein